MEALATIVAIIGILEIIGKLSLPWQWKQSNNGYHDNGSKTNSNNNNGT